MVFQGATLSCNMFKKTCFIVIYVLYVDRVDTSIIYVDYFALYRHKFNFSLPDGEIIPQAPERRGPGHVRRDHDQCVTS